MRIIGLFIGPIIGLTLSAPPARASEEPVTVFAAASLTSVLQELLPRDTTPRVRLSFAGSSSLARQIDAGAPADLYVAANRDWMDWLQARGRIDSTTRVDLAANRLVVIAPRGEAFAVRAETSFDLGGAFEGRLAIADPDHVPAGIYARQALQSLAWWPGLARRLAPVAHVRAALVLVERGECAAGIVYATDAASSRGVEVLAALPDSLHDPIVYPAAIVAGRRRPAVEAVLERLQGAAAHQALARHGFSAVAVVDTASTLR
jgi:molybdate transport system substrate-binding protein